MLTEMNKKNKQDYIFSSVLYKKVYCPGKIKIFKNIYFFKTTYKFLDEANYNKILYISK